jgi:serine/threonine protein kinase
MASCSTPPFPCLPERIGKYRIVRRLGEGTTAEVFLGHDEFHDRPVAVKRVRAAALADSVDGHVFARFFASEAALAGRLHHPNVVQIYDAVPDPIAPYVVMEYVPGTTLRAWCQPGHQLGLEQIVEVGFKCAMALGYCYRQGLVHRDVKPANILTIDTSGTVTDVKVTDFGSALNLTSDATQVHRVGSLAYMSPEQLDGSELDARADIYSLGAVLYHLIAGRAPFEASNQASLMHQICHTDAPSLVGQRSGVTEALDRVVQRCLAKRADHRYPSWEALGEALSQLIALHHVPRGALQGVLDSERFTLLRQLEFFTQFGDVALWEVVHRARWQRFPVGHKLYRPRRRGAQLPHHCRRCGGGVPGRATGGAAGLRHLGRRDGLPGPKPGTAPAQHRRGGDRKGHHHLLHPRGARPTEPELPPPLR